MNFAHSALPLALVSSHGLFFTLFLLIYYFALAENTSKANPEKELRRLKAAYDNGEITEDEYAGAKQDVLNRL